MSSDSSRDLFFLVRKFLEEEKLKKTIHMLEKESGIFFDMLYFEEVVLAGDWEEAESYLSAFTKLDDNRFSTKIYFEIRKLKYLEALDLNPGSKVVLDILLKDLKVFKPIYPDSFEEIAGLLVLDDFRENDRFSGYGDMKTARAQMLPELKWLIEANPMMQEKMRFPIFYPNRLRTLVNQGLTWEDVIKR